MDDRGFAILWGGMGAFGTSNRLHELGLRQKLAILPGKPLVVVQLIATRGGPHRDRTRAFLDRLDRIARAAP